MGQTCVSHNKSTTLVELLYSTFDRYTFDYLGNALLEYYGKWKWKMEEIFGKWKKIIVNFKSAN